MPIKSRWKGSARYREYQRNYHKVYRINHREKLLEYYKIWKIKNREKFLKSRSVRAYEISVEDYLKITEKCSICGFSEVVHCHHIKPKSLGGENRIKNYIGLCPNHHQMIHLKNYRLVEENGKFHLTFSNKSQKKLVLQE